MRVTAKYPIRAGKSLIPRGHQGTVSAPSPDMLAAFPNLHAKLGGQYLCVAFDPVQDAQKIEILVMKDQVVEAG